MALTGRFWFRKTWTGKLVLLIEERKPSWFRKSAFKLRWRDAKLLDLAEIEMRPLMDLERSHRADYAARRSPSLYAVPAAKPEPTGVGKTAA
ncbi:hypothetical protein MOX02_43560 [Methylobacterium oxalidis]|uniref:Uncharacterized protein n=1 Tax=Methylobacterium oxalidis TaxID=944322 RepID=A0A512J8P3_9HYPH|nr:hypothetical protein [Methylobacterium oxalidis]GEP06318.1 hypothetical protein MOX02_43560 [Methylobacterium oxalidis]GJE30896.1 hypothetical protein LDDCCGHA_1066 [Methylobacterium oxalidis]GLS64367.1 hypothetical protein GCM10007888_27480 [Methylobacterium oxalidis]